MEAIVYELEEGRVGLAEALARYEEGVGLLRQCFALLETAERRIELLTGVDAAGNPVVEPYDDTASADQAEQGTRRSRQRSAGSSKPAKASRAPAQQAAASQAIETPSATDSSIPPEQSSRSACDPDAPPGPSKIDSPGRLF
jgi:exodeoxyribonuclease VII small subunit